MGRETTFNDNAFNRNNMDSESEFIENLVFVIMSFRGDMNETYKTIQETCSELGLLARRADDGVGSDFVIRDILKFIEDAEFIICDLTHERPNCYYELGYAHGVGNLPDDILLVAKTGTELHFDIAPLRVRYYSSGEELHLLIKTNLKRMMEVTRS